MTNKERYREFCKTESMLPLWVQDWYLDACCSDGIWEVVLVEEKGKIVASLPYFIKQKFGFKYITMPMFVKNMGPYVTPTHRSLKQTHQYYDALIMQLPRVASFKQNFYPDVTNWLPFYWTAHQQTTYYTYQFQELNDLAKIETGFNKSIRRNLRKANKLLELDLDLDAAEFYDVNTWSFERQGKVPPYSKAQFLRLDAALAEHGARQIFCARDENGRIHSASYLVWDKHTSYYLASGDDPDLRKSGSGIFLCWEAVKYTQEVLGLNCFDFEGSIIQRLETIRVQFGAKQIPYFYVWKYHSSVYRLLEVLRAK